MTELIIDTSDRFQATVEVQKGQEHYQVVSDAIVDRSQSTLLLIDQVLNDSKTSLKELDMLSVVRGPGSFTGLRVGVSIANTLSYALQIPFKNQKLGYSEEVVY
jgi:tRNA threonylcarbamoyladenosine biosynthesis protein TsaB